MMPSVTSEQTLCKLGGLGRPNLRGMRLQQGITEGQVDLLHFITGDEV